MRRRNAALRVSRGFTRPAARSASSQQLTAEILRELAFVDVQAGRHASAARALREASAQAEATGDPALTARVLAIRGMKEADQGHHDTAVRLLACSARTAASAGSARQEAWSTGVMARSLLLAHRAPAREDGHPPDNGQDQQLTGGIQIR